MNISKHAARLAALSVLALSSISVPAIEGLQISVKCPDVILSWPSASGETYIVQYRPTLDPSTPWVTLTNSLPADATTNWTSFVDSNRVQCASGGTNNFSGGGSEPPPTPSSAAQSASAFWASQPMVRRADGSGSTVPLCIYPPGIDLSPFIIFDPSTGEWMSGSGYVVSQPSLNRLQPNGPQPNDPDPQDGPPPPDPGFYQVVRDGVHIVGLSNLTSGPVSNVITIQFEAGNSVGTLQDVTVLVDSVRYRGAEGMFAPAIGGGVPVDTSFLENGDHTFQLQVGWLNLDPADPNNFMIHRTSDPFTLTVSNVIYYPDWVDTISELGSAAYFLKTTCTNADWQIDIYDVNTNFVQSLTGHTDDGIIEAYWDMVDTNGVIRTNVDIDPEFSAEITVADPVKKKTPRQPTLYPFPDHGRWAISYQDTFSFMVNSNTYYNAVYQMGALGANAGGAYTVFPSTPANGQCFPIRYMNTNQPINFGWVRADEGALMGLLTNRNFRNFYYNGHGGPKSISIFLSSDKFRYALKRQYYRFVFLDACSSANGDLPAAFGINYNAMRSLSDFQKDKTRPRSFLGYNRDIAYCESGSFLDPVTGNTYGQRVRPEVTYFLTNFEFYWYFNYSLYSAIYNAIQDTPYIGPGWQTGQDLELYGYDMLGLDAYNYKTDWSN